MPRSLALLFTLGLVIPLVAAKCGGGSTSYLAGGEVVGDSLSHRAVDYELTSDNYRRWLAAQDALDSTDAEGTVRLDTRRLTDEDIDRAIRELEARAKARAAIESVGFSVRDYVLTTIVLAQSWDAVNDPGSRAVGLRAENIEFLRRQAAEDGAVRQRPRARFIDDDSDSDSDGDSERRGGKHRGRRGRGSDSDS